MPEVSKFDMRVLPTPIPPAATSLDRSHPDSLSALYRAALGPVNAGYYLPLFAHFEASGRAGPSWNRTACLCTLNWLVFRQMGRVALLYAAAVLGAVGLVMGIGTGLLGLSEVARFCLLIAIAIVAFAVPGIWGNALLYRQLRKVMSASLAATATVAEACVLLNRQASSRERATWLALANAVIAGAAIGAYIAWPQPERATSHGANGSKMAVATRGVATAAPGASAASATPGASAASATLGASAAFATPAAFAPPAAASAAAALFASPAPPARSATAASSATPAPAFSLPAATTPDGEHAVAGASVQDRPRRSAPASLGGPVAAPAAPPPAAPARLSAARDFFPHVTAAAPHIEASLVRPTYGINVGLYARAENAQKALTQLREAGLPASAQELDGANGKRTRVRSGPFDGRAQADAAAEKIRSLKLEAQVFRQ